MTTEPLAISIARDNARHGRPTGPNTVQSLLDTIDRLERAAELQEDD